MRYIFLTLMFYMLSSCAIYKIDIQQGNIVTQEVLDQLTPKMAAKKVRLILGTPLIQDPFQPQRWDYIYRFRSGKGQRQQRHISLFFDNEDNLKGINGDIRIQARQEHPSQPQPEVLEPVPIL